MLWSNNGAALREAALRSQGIVLLPDFIVGEALAANTLIRVLPDQVPSPLTVSAVYPRHRHLSNKVRQFVELASEYLGTADSAAH